MTSFAWGLSASRWIITFGLDGDHPDFFDLISLEGLFFHAIFHSFWEVLAEESSATMDNAKRVGSMNAPEQAKLPTVTRSSPVWRVHGQLAHDGLSANQ